MQAPASSQKKCAMKMKQRNKQEKNDARKNVIDGWKPFIGRIRKTSENDLDKLRVNDSGHNEGTISLVNWCQGDGWHSGLVAPISSIVGLLILCS